MMSKEAMKLVLEAVYETIIEWDEGGGKRSRRELARRIVALAEQPAQQCQYPKCSYPCPDLPDCRDAEQPAQQEPVTWRNAAIRVGEDLCSVGPFGYYDMTAEQWLDWALSVVTVHAPPAQRTWVGLTDEEIYSVLDNLQVMHHRPPTTDSRVIFALAIEAKLKEKNT